MTGRLLSVLETQQRIMERQLAGQVGVAGQRMVGLGIGERVEGQDNQEVA